MRGPMVAVSILAGTLVLAGCGSSKKPDVTPPDAPAAAAAKPVPTGDMSGMLRISWHLQSQENVLGFNVYRSESADGPWKQVNKAPVPGHDTTSSPHGYEYWDTGIEIGREYHYYVEEVTYSGTTDKITPVLSSAAKPRQYYLDKGMTPP